jgi:hypothetical protein
MPNSSAKRLRYRPFVHLPQFHPSSPEELHLKRNKRPLLVMTELDEKWPVNLVCDSDFHVNSRDLLHAAMLRHGTDGFTSPSKKGVLWIFAQV